MTSSRPVWQILLSVVFLFSAANSLLLAFLFGFLARVETFALAAVFFLILGILHGFATAGIWLKKRWGLGIAVVASSIQIILSVVRLVFTKQPEHIITIIAFALIAGVLLYHRKKSRTN